MDDPVDAFIAAVRLAGVAEVVLAVQEEWDLTDARGFGPVRRARLVAYHAGAVIASDLTGDTVDTAAVAERLRAAGLHVELRHRNRN